MEKKKLLLVAVSVGIFLVIVIGATIILVQKGKEPSATPREAHLPGMAGTISTPNPVGTPGLPPAAGGPEAGINPEMANPPLGPLDPNQPASADAISMLKNPDMNTLKPPPGSINHYYGDSNTIYSSSDVIYERYTPEIKTKPVDPPKASPASTPAASVKPAASSPPAAAPAAVQAPKAAPAKIYDDYWVQTGSFSTKARADSVKENLAAKGINSVIEVRDVNSKTWYRVRVGPYTSQNEAEYWLSLIKSINGFEESQIWRSQSKH